NGDQHRFSIGGEAINFHPRLAFTADGKSLITVGDNNAEVWLRDWKTGAVHRKLPGLKGVSADNGIVFGPAGRLVAFRASRSGRLTLRQLDAAVPCQQTFHLFPLTGFETNGVAFSPEGRYVATGCPDGTICLLRLAERGQVPKLPFAHSAEERANWSNPADA